jgi:hypothetical protein
MYTCGQLAGKNSMNESIEPRNDNIILRKRELDRLELKGVEALGLDIRKSIEEILVKEKNPRHLASMLIDMRNKFKLDHKE